MGLAVLLAVALQVSVDAPPKVYEVEFAPLRGAELSYKSMGPVGPYYPQWAGDHHLNGEGVLKCQAGEAGLLLHCAPVAETPNGTGFSIAARIMAERKRVKAVGSPPVGETILVRVPFVIGAPVTSG